MLLLARVVLLLYWHLLHVSYIRYSLVLLSCAYLDMAVLWTYVSVHGILVPHKCYETKGLQTGPF